MSTLTETRNHAEMFAGGNYAVIVSSLAAAYGRISVLRDVNLALREGESVSIMGPNGAGKSTLLKCLIGALRPGAGRITCFGEAVTHTKSARRQIGYVGPECGLYSELTVLENLQFSGRMYGVANVRERVEGLLTEAQLESCAHRPAGQLSKGMQQRVAIVRVLVHEPRFIVLDEPAANLDAAGRRWLRRLFERWRQAGQTVCFASHDVPQANDLADRIVELDGGRVVAITEGRGPISSLRLAA